MDNKTIANAYKHATAAAAQMMCVEKDLEGYGFPELYEMLEAVGDSVCKCHAIATTLKNFSTKRIYKKARRERK